MATMRKFIYYPVGIVAAIAMLSVAALFAQEAEEEPADEVDTIEEIIVVAPRPGSRKRLDQELPVVGDWVTIRRFRKLQQANGKSFVPYGLDVIRAAAL